MSGNGNDGINVFTNVATTVTSSTVSGNKGDGIEVQKSVDTVTAGALFAGRMNTISMNTQRGVFVTGLEGPVSGILESNTISANGYEGVRIEDAGEDTGHATYMVFDSNTVSGNLTATTPPADATAGGVFFASSDGNNIKLNGFFGNKVFGNAKDQIGFESGPGRRDAVGSEQPEQHRGHGDGLLRHRQAELGLLLRYRPAWCGRSRSQRDQGEGEGHALRPLATRYQPGLH